MGGAEIAIREVTKRLEDRFEFVVITGRGTRMSKWLLIIRGPYVARRYITPETVLWGMDLSQASVAAALASVLWRVPFVFTIQYGYGRARVRRGRLGLIGLALRFILSRADRVTAISNYLRDLVKSYGYRGPIEVIPNGVDTSKFQTSKHKIQDNHVRLITTSRLVKKNAVHDIIAALEYLPEHITLDIVGDGPERKNLTLGARVRFLGYLPQGKMIEYMHAADIFVRPSRSEGLGNSFLEAMALGLPVIGTDVEGIKDFLAHGETGWVVPVGNPRAIASAVQDIVASPEKTARIAERAYALVRERYDWDTIAERYETHLHPYT